MPANLQAIPGRRSAREKCRAGEGARPAKGRPRSGEPRPIADILAELPELRFIFPPSPPRAAGDKSLP
jgi:hypothetical protein